MASKRPLYQPASDKGNVGKRKTRKPLVQGRLTENDRSQHEGFLIPSGETLDPTLSPMRSVPVLTEQSSPRPEPPSRCLDLSDVDLDLSTNSEGRRSVMVCDASHLGTSPTSTEVDVYVAYEDSPARVVCHTPRELERSFRSSVSAGVNGQDVPFWKVSVGKVPKVASSMSSSAKNPVKKLFQSPEESPPGTGPASDSYISRRSRGIIQEILTQELGKENMDAISLNSQSSSPSPRHTSTSTAGAEMSSHRESVSQTDPHRNNDKANSSRSHHSKSGHLVPMSSSPLDVNTNQCYASVSASIFKLNQPRFDEDSDKVPVREHPLSQPRPDPKVQTDTDSDACSLYEYVTPRKPQDIQKKVKVSAKVRSATKTAPGQHPASAKKKKTGKVVQSRYMQNSSNQKSNQASKNSSSELSNMTMSSNSGRARFVPAAKKDSVLPSKPKLRQTSHNKQSDPSARFAPVSSNTCRPKHPRSATPQTLVQAGDSDGDHGQPSQKTSTPTHDQLVSLSQSIDASAIHSVSSLQYSLGPKGLSSLSDDQSAGPRHAARKPTAKPDLELSNFRYRQAEFLLAKMRHSFSAQEQMAMSQLSSLWKLVEERRRETFKLDQEVARLRRMVQVDSLLDLQETGLDTLVDTLPGTEKDFSGLHSALDSTRHQLPTADIYFPREEDKEAQEEQLVCALRATESLLSQLSTVTGDHTLPVGQYLTGLEAIYHNVQASRESLQGCQRDLNVIEDLTTRLVSMSVQAMARQ